jgi:hypothetical protein
MAKAIVDPFGAHMKVPGWIDRFRAMIDKRIARDG